MLEKLKFAWYWTMVFLFGKDGGRDTGVIHESTTWVREDSNGVVDILPVVETRKVAKEVEETPVVTKEVVDTLPIEETPVVTKEATSNRTGKKLLKDDDVRYIRKNAKVSKKELAAKFNVSEETIRRIIKGDTYKDVK